VEKIERVSCSMVDAAMMRVMPLPRPRSVGRRRAVSGTAPALLLVLLCGACLHRVAPTPGANNGLVFWQPHLPLAEGLFDTFELLHSTDDCGKLDIPGLNCTVRTWDFQGTTLEVLPPPGFEVVAQGLEKNYWFTLRCVSAPASGSAQVNGSRRTSTCPRMPGTIKPR
jgi:hypothetical protein